MININCYWLIDHNKWNLLIYWLIFIAWDDWEIAWQWLIERLRDIDWLTEILLIGIGIWLIQRFDWLIQRFDWWSYLWTSLININLHWLIDHNWYNWLIYCLILIDCVILIDLYDCLILIDWEIAWYWLIQRLRDVDWLID